MVPFYAWSSATRSIGEAPPLTPSELPFYIAGEDVDRLMYGLRLRYPEHRRVYEPVPAISVAPVIFLRSLRRLATRGDTAERP